MNYKSMQSQAKAIISRFGNNNIKLENAGRKARVTGILVELTSKNRPETLVIEATRVLYLAEELRPEFLEPGTTAQVGKVLFNIVQVEAVSLDSETDILYKAYLST